MSLSSIAGMIHYICMYKYLYFTETCLRCSLRAENKNQRTSGPVNAHLTPGPCIYSNAFIHVYNLRAGTDKPLGSNVDVNRKPLSLCPLVASFKINLFEV